VWSSGNVTAIVGDVGIKVVTILHLTWLLAGYNTTLLLLSSFLSND
jgi:hypothetical protein